MPDFSSRDEAAAYAAMLTRSLRTFLADALKASLDDSPYTAAAWKRYDGLAAEATAQGFRVTYDYGVPVVWAPLDMLESLPE